MDTSNDAGQLLTQDDSIEQALHDVKLTSPVERDVYIRTREALQTHELSSEVGTLMTTRLLLAFFSTGSYVNSTGAPPSNSRESVAQEEEEAAPMEIEDSPENQLREEENKEEPKETSVADDDPARTDAASTSDVSLSSLDDRDPLLGQRKKDALLEQILQQQNTTPPERYLRHLASDLAAVLVNEKERLRNSQSKESATATPTVAEICLQYAHIFGPSPEQEESVNPASDLYRSITGNAPDEHQVVQLKEFLSTSLVTMQRAAVQMMEDRSDFLYLWRSCTAHEAYQQALVGMELEDSGIKNENQKRPRQQEEDSKRENMKVLQETKVCAWKLSRLTSSTMDEGSADSSSTSRRRRQILASAASLGLLALLESCESVLNNEEEEDDVKEEEDDVKTSSKQESLTADQASEDDDDEDKTSQPLAPPPSKVTRSRHSEAEDDCIAAMRMMVKSVSPKPSRRNVEREDALDLVVRMARTLISALSSADPNAVEKITREDVEDEIVAMAHRLVACLASPAPVDVKRDVSLDAEDLQVAEELDGLAPPVEEKRAPLMARLTGLFSTLEGIDRLVDTQAIDASLTSNLRRWETTVKWGETSNFPFVDQAGLSPLSYRGAALEMLCQRGYRNASPVIALVVSYEGSSEISALLSKSRVSDRASSEVMELNEWTVTVLTLTHAKPSPRLNLYFEASDDFFRKKSPSKLRACRNVIVATLNRVIGRVGRFQSETSTSESPRTGSVSVNTENAETVIAGRLDDESQLFISLVAVYYHALECILYDETARLKSACHPKLLLSEEFHRALLSCCYTCLLKSVFCSGALELQNRYEKLDFLAVVDIMETAPYTYLKVSESFSRAVRVGQTRTSSSLLAGFPRILQRHISECDILLIDQTLWSHQTALADTALRDTILEIKKPETKSWPPPVLEPNLPEEAADRRMNGFRRGKPDGVAPEGPEQVFLSYVLRRLLKIAYFRITALCSALQIPPNYPVATQVWLAFRFLLRHNIELLYDRHLDQLILCTLYGVCKMMKYQPELTFSSIINIYTSVRGDELGERGCQRIVRHVRLRNTEFEPSSKRFKNQGNVIHLYNRIFVPAMKNHLLHSVALRKATQVLQECMARKAAERTLFATVEAPTGEAPLSANHGATDVNLNDPAVSSASGYKPEPMKEQPNGQPVTSGADFETPKNRSFYSFGGAAVKDLHRVNAMVTTESGEN